MINILVDKSPTEEQKLLLEKILRTAEVGPSEYSIVLVGGAHPPAPVIVAVGMKAAKSKLGKFKTFGEVVGKPFLIDGQLVVAMPSLEKLLKGKLADIQEAVRLFIKCKNYNCSPYSS